MRNILIDLSSDNYLEQPQIFGGYAGEHNETILQIKLPDRMIGTEYSGYRFDFQTSEDNKISSPLIPISELDNGVLSFHLTEQLTIAGKLFFNIAATLSNKDVVYLTSKTNMVALYIGDSPEGNNILPNPAGYKDEILKMIDARIVEITGNGATFTPSVSEAGVISWTNDKNLNNPDPVNIKGEDGKDGVSVTHQWDGTVLTVISASGTSSVDLKGEKGDDGTDYILNDSDINAIANRVYAKFTDVAEVGQ